MAETQITAEILRASARGLAGLAAERLLPRVTASLGSNPLESWRDHLDGRLADLAMALDEGRPATFLEQVAWAKVAFSSRDLPVADLRSSLECLREVVGEELPAAIGNPALSLLGEASARFDELGVTAGEALSADGPHGELAARYMLAVLEGDRAAATSRLLDAVRDGALSVQDALLEVVFAAQRELGRMWHMNEISVAEEHVVSATSSRIIGQLGALAAPAERNGRSVLVAALADDEHDIGLRVLAELFELDGWRSVLVGGRLPEVELADAVARFEADLVLLSASVDSHRRAITRAVAALRRGGSARADVPVIVGGPAFVGRPDAGESVGADACVQRGADVLAVGRRLVGLDADA